MKKAIWTWILPCMFLVSCTSVAHLKTSDSSESYAATNADGVEVYSVDDIGKEYTVIGMVVADADAGTDGNTPVKLLKKEAAKLGADAIINLELEIDQGYWSNGVKATGTAVKFK